MFGFIKQVLTGFLWIKKSLASIVNTIGHTNVTLINLYPNEYPQRLSYYPLAINLDRCMGSCNTCNDLSNRICIPNKAEDLNLNVFYDNRNKRVEDIIKRYIINASLTVRNVIPIERGTMVNVGASANIQDIIHVNKIVFGILLHVVVKMVNI